MPDYRLAVSALALFCLAPTQAIAAPWWYVAHGADRAVFIDAGSIARQKGVMVFTSKMVIRKPGDPVAMTVSYMKADCAKRRLGWVGIQRFGHDEAVIDTSTRRDAEMADAAGQALGAPQLAFVCSEGRASEAPGAFALTVDDAAFTEAVLREPGETARAVQDRMVGDASVPVVRSTAPAPETFGQVQTVKLGEPLVPPRDYAKGTQVPDPKLYDGIEVGTIYDIAYQGIKDGQIQFEVRGYSIDDLVHPGSGQTETADPREKTVKVRDLRIAIKAALPDRIAYTVAVEKAGAEPQSCPPGGC